MQRQCVQAEAVCTGGGSVYRRRQCGKAEAVSMRN